MICAVVLAAGEGVRLRPLTERVPKALCPVGNVPLLDLALDRLARLGLTGPSDVAVNACYLADQVVAAGATVTGTAAEAVIGAGARVEGTVTRGVVWPGGYVGPDEHLTDAIRYGRSGTVTG